jgi:hypothetical protein
MKILIAVLAGLIAWSPVPAHSQTLSFRGLDSSSQRNDVLRIFPEARVESQCRNGEEYSRSADGLTQCDVLTVEYELDAQIFNGTFLFNTEGSLRYIGLTHSFGWGRDEAGIIPRETAESAFRSLADLLASKYGPSVSDTPRSLLGHNPLSQERQWQPGGGTRWRSGGDRISLTSDLRVSRTSPELYKGSLQVFYTFARRGEFDRF